MKVSALILTWNEERNIKACLASLSGIEDVLVVDSGSTDRTCELAKENGARVLTRAFDNFANQRNFGLEEGGLRHEWVLHLDADEVLTSSFLSQLERLAPEPGVYGYRVPSKTILNGHWLRFSGMYPTYQVRIGHRDLMRFRQVGHGQREDLLPEQVGTFHEPYLHYNFSHGLVHWLRKHAGYAENEASQFFRDRKEPVGILGLASSDATERRRVLKRLVNRLPIIIRPPLRFFHAYVLRCGFLEGWSGLQYATMLSCYEAMIVACVLEKATTSQSEGYRS